MSQLDLTYDCDCDEARSDPHKYRDTLPWFVCEALENCSDSSKSTCDCGGAFTPPLSITVNMNGDRHTTGVPPLSEQLETATTNPIVTDQDFPTDGPGSGPEVTQSSFDLVLPLTASTTIPPTSYLTTPTTASIPAIVSLGAVISSSTSSPTAASSTSSNKGLSTGAKAGIAVGSIAGFALLAGLVFFLFWKRRKQDHTPLTEEGKALEYEPAGAAGMTHDPYTDSPVTAHGHSPQGPGYSAWGQQSTEPIAPVAGAAAVASQTPYNRPASGMSRDVPSPAVAGGYWQQSANQSPVSNNRQSFAEAAPRASMQSNRPVEASPPQYVAYTPSAQMTTPTSAVAPSVSRGVDDNWDEDERRIEAEIAEIERMRQLREERSALR